jgi:hypothetical protein
MAARIVRPPLAGRNSDPASTAPSLGHRVDRTSAAFWILAPTRDKAPTKRLQGPLARLVVLSDREQLLARRAVVSTGKVVEPVISHIETVDDRKVHRTSGLYDAPAHAAKVVIDPLVVKLWERALCTKQILPPRPLRNPVYPPAGRLSPYCCSIHECFQRRQILAIGPRHADKSWSPTRAS